MSLISSKIKPDFRQQKIKKSNLRILGKIFKKELHNSTIGAPYFWHLQFKSPVLEKWKRHINEKLDIHPSLIMELYTSEVVTLDESHLLYQEPTVVGKINLLLKFVDDKGESALLLFIAVLCNDCKHINVELGRLLEREGQYVNFKQQKIKKSNLRILGKIFKTELHNSSIGAPYFWHLHFKSPVLEKWKRHINETLVVHPSLIMELCTTEVVSLDESHLLNQEPTVAGKINLFTTQICG